MRPHLFQVRATSPVAASPGAEFRARGPSLEPTFRPRPHLGRLLDRAAALRPDHPAVEDQTGRVASYRELAHAAERIAARLGRYGVGRGDRVGLFLPKGVEAVAAIHGVLRSGAAYVPVDATAPVTRGAGILADAWVKAVVVSAELASRLAECWPGPGPLPRLIVVGEGPPPRGACRWEDVIDDDAPAPVAVEPDPDDPAYLLYTSGSTGAPKGVVLTHANAFCFLDWCAETFGAALGGRFASHAPFQFDLSVFDLYACARVAGTLVLIGEALGKNPIGLGDFLADRRIDVWYSAPSILSLLADYGKVGRPAFPAPRLVLFAGEVFPIRPLKKLRTLWPDALLWNLYGPTETNVCTAYKIPEAIDDDRQDPFPIGPPCGPFEARVVDDAGRDVPPGGQGELVVAGAGVMRGYFGRPDLTAPAFLVDPDGRPWYRTGDLVVESRDGYVFRGRRDRMVKRRGYRIELGEIEAALYRHAAVDRAAVVSSETQGGTRITAFVALKPGEAGSMLALKQHCAETLPSSMIPDAIRFLDALPATATAKIDYPALLGLAD